MKSLQIVIVGCGRLGSTLANQLSAVGHRVVIIDRDEAAFDKLSAEFSGFRVVADAVEFHTLKEARISQADGLFATTTEDNINLMVAQVAAKIFQIRLVVARVYDPVRESMYQDFGIKTISPTQLSVESFLQTLREDNRIQS